MVAAIGDMKLRGFQRMYIRRVRLIQQYGEFAEDGTRLRHPGRALGPGCAWLWSCGGAG